MSAQLLSLRGYARHREVTLRSVQLALADGRIHAIEGKIDPDAADREWAENTDLARARNSVTGKPGKGKKLKANGNGHATSVDLFNTHRSRRMLAEAEIAEMDLAERRGIMLKASEVERAAFETARRTRDELMKIPDRIAPELVGIKDPHECKRIIIKALREALQGLSGK